MIKSAEKLDSTQCENVGRSCACFSLRRAARAVTRLYDGFLRPSGLRSTQFSVLMAAHLRGPITLSKLAQITVTERTTLTRNLAILEKKGFIHIETGEDRRERRIGITRDGQEILAACLPLWEAAQTHVEREIGGNRVRGLLKDLSAIISLSRKG